MFNIFQSIRNWWRSTGSPSVWLKDRAAGVEIRSRYGTQDWAQRHPKTAQDINAPKINANVYIATRAISDAIKGLPVNIVESETIGGIEREIDNNDHPANELLRNPNPEHSWSEVIDHVVKSYLNDGNAILTIERNTGPNPRVEIWPRDPRHVEIGTENRSYRFGQHTAEQITYPRSRIIHMRDMDVEDPFWGLGRVNTVREEIMMDYFINRFNSNFFKFGATLNLMFTPDHDLSEDQHGQILDAMSAEIGGAEKAFKIFINKYAGKFEFPDQKHTDIAFESLLKSNREKIFGVFGLPPFRGGVMEYANYANALAQDMDFWLNTIAPILKVIEDGINKQLLTPLYGPDIRLKFDLDSVPAIKGDQTEIENRLIQLQKAGIVSKEYVREQLNIDEDAAPDEKESISPVDKDENEPERDEQQEVENALFKLFRAQRNQVLKSTLKMTAGGSIMSALCDPHSQSLKVYDTVRANRSIKNNLQPILRQVLMDRGTKIFEGVGIFDIDHELTNGLIRRVAFQVEDIVEQNVTLLRAVLDDADRYDWNHRQLEKSIKLIFSYERSHDIAHTVLTDFINNATLILEDMKIQRGSEPLTVAILMK